MADENSIEAAFQIPIPLPEMDARYVDLTSPSNMDAFVYVKIPFSIYLRVLKYLESSAKNDKNVVKGGWSSGEDEKLVKLVETFGARGWNQIAQHLPGRQGKQCRERYINHLDPRVCKEKWTTEEDLSIMAAYRHYGPQWSKISKLLPKPRTANATKNHWNSSLKKIYQETYGDLNDEEAPNDTAAQIAIPGMTTFMQPISPVPGLVYTGAPLLGCNGFGLEIPCAWPLLPPPAPLAMESNNSGNGAAHLPHLPHLPMTLPPFLSPAPIWDAESGLTPGSALHFPAPLPTGGDAENESGVQCLARACRVPPN
eukprot:GGOE01003485.1.p1 GENE.GGOE01003485.1~~GGOE01003485.1.p1  ORF type:complete len:312 (+),score=16.99 GGOE01003485.1:69-1004(+)